MLTETDTRLKFITPAITGNEIVKWDLVTQVFEEYHFTKGRVAART